MKLYFDRERKGVSVAIHIRSGWIHFQLHNLWGMAQYRKSYPKAVFVGPLMIAWCFDG